MFTKGNDKMYNYEIIYKNKCGNRTVAIGKMIWVSDICRLTEITLKTIMLPVECYVWDEKGVNVGGYWNDKYHGGLAVFMNLYATELWDGVIE